MEGQASRDPSLALDRSSRAAELITTNPAEAEGLLRKALTADIFCGPAHNNLGILFLKEGDFYEAAQEFEWARKLMPGNPTPRVNLALTLDRAGQDTEAIVAYESALAVAPEYLPAIQGLVALERRLGVRGEAVSERLRSVQLRSRDVRWREWAEKELLHSRR